ncbi:MAG TPA: ABC transporter permease [Gemmatimonadaceae bacterium]
MQDAQYTLRVLRRAPSFSAVAVLTLALGIASTTAAFSVVDAVVLRGLPYHEPNRLLTVYERSDEGGLRVPSYPTFRDWQAQSAAVSRAIEGTAFVRGDGVLLPMPGGDERAISAYVTPGFFGLMGTRPILGRTFLPDEEQPGAPPVAVLSYDYFLKQFGGNPSVIGKIIDVDSVPTTVIGVMPHAFVYPNFSGGDELLAPSVWQPIALFRLNHAALDQRGLHVDSRAIMRLRSGTDSARAAAAMRTIATRLATEYPIEQAHWTNVAFQSLSDELFGNARGVLTVVSGAIGLVLLLACANVANLLLTRASARRQELAIRSALGAGRWRLARQLLTEALFLSVAAGAVGLLLASMLVGYLRRSATSRIPFASELGVDHRALLFALAASMLTALLVGVLPALQGSGGRLMDRVRASSSGAIGGARDAWARNVLVAVQFALALTLLLAAGLLIQSFRRLLAVPLGYDPSETIEFAIAPPAHRYDAPAEAAALYARILAAVRAVPGVVGIAATSGAQIPTKVETDATSNGRPVESALYRTVSADYQKTMRIPMVAGRWFTEDDMRSPNGFVVSDRLARMLWPGGSALGKRITVRRSSQMRADFGQPISMPVIGVISNVREGGPDDDPQAEVYLPYTLEVWPWMRFVARAQNAARALPIVDRAVRDVEPALRFLGKPSVSETGMDAIDPQRRFVTFVLIGFAVCALLLATIGLYGTVAYGVVQRTRELGVRIALGASARNILALVMRDGLSFVFLGALVGILGAVAATRVIRTLLFATPPTDMATFVVVPTVLATAALLASYFSARRATRTDPMVAIRGD